MEPIIKLTFAALFLADIEKEKGIVNQKFNKV